MKAGEMTNEHLLGEFSLWGGSRKGLARAMELRAEILKRMSAPRATGAREIAERVVQEVEKVSAMMKGPRFAFVEFIDEVERIIAACQSAAPTWPEKAQPDGLENERDLGYNDGWNDCLDACKAAFPAPAGGERPRQHIDCPKCGSAVTTPYKSTETGLWTQRCSNCAWFDSWAGLEPEPPQGAGEPDWRIVIENVPADAPLIGTEKEYWGFSIFCGVGDNRLGCGSADDLVTCANMAVEMMEDMIKVGECGVAAGMGAEASGSNLATPPLRNEHSPSSPEPSTPDETRADEPHNPNWREQLMQPAAAPSEAVRAALGTNYVANDAIYPSRVEFANGRVVSIRHEDGHIFLGIGMKETS